ncbi:MAG: carboxypeptidase-like regulatory domain-containing protein, partial [Ignavibacteria bacterium]|nr:carboxypeptidase-like regulatory domain-containing protein [Ignavibacteria bacterium]
MPSFLYSQHQEVKLRGKNITIKTAFEQIEKQTGLSVNFDAKVIDVTKVLKVLPEPATLNIVLTKLLENTHCNYKILNKHIIITEARPVSEQSQVSILNNPQTVKSVSGVVKDAVTGEALLGVNILAEGTRIGTISDLNGMFTLDVPSPSVLIFSYVGYNSKKVIFEKQDKINVTLEQDLQALNEVVVIGYGTQRKGDVTSSVASVKPSEFNKGAVKDLGQLVAGKVAGLIITNPSGDP